MQKLLITGILAIAMVSAHAQAKLEVGLKGGLNLANMSSDFEATYESRTGYHLGAYTLIKVANVGIQPELLYSAQGTTYTFSSINQDLQRDLKYFTVPVMLKFYLPLGLNLQAGPQFGFLVNAEGDTYTINGNQVEIQTGQDLKNELKNSDISAVLGAGWDLPFGLNIAARYLIGVNDIHESEEEDSKNRVFQVSVGFRLFKVGK
ncbi:MAG: PorT family protein [Cyclobacteriaceae bacterium]|nr:PorT family protein [Cyclobacteriaceae bacterium SS2]